MKRTVTNLCIIHQHPRILLGMKKRGFGTGRWNGFGGKVLPDETIEESLMREVEEEAGIKLKKIKKVGYMEFEFAKNGEIIEVHVFKSDSFTGAPMESEEMNPVWFHVDEIPFDKMWPDDKFWIPLFLSGKKFKGKFLFGESDVILEQELTEIEEI
jgi:8-oxo-dGTP diphosphatase/2-hydroxy-dATP diphosphatase